MISISNIFSTVFASENPLSQYDELNCIYQVTHPIYSDHKIYLLGTQHADHEVSENVVNTYLNIKTFLVRFII
ncbi:MAG: hypothetical protein ACRYGR_04190 [Janthinobacterium lividum]